MDAVRCHLSPVDIEGGSLHGFTDSDVKYVLFSEVRSVLLPHVAPSTLQRRKREVLAASPAGERHSKCPAAYLQLYKQEGLLKPDARQADVLTVQQAAALLQDSRRRGRSFQSLPGVASSLGCAATLPEEQQQQQQQQQQQEEEEATRDSNGGRLLDQALAPELGGEEEEEEEEGQGEPESKRARLEPHHISDDDQEEREEEQEMEEEADRVALGGSPHRRPRSLRLDTRCYPSLRQEMTRFCRALKSGGKGGPPMPPGTSSGLADSTIKKTVERVESEHTNCDPRCDIARSNHHLSPATHSLPCICGVHQAREGTKTGGLGRH